MSPSGDRVYAAIFESGNASTILGGGARTAGAFPPNVVNDPTGPVRRAEPAAERRRGLQSADRSGAPGAAGRRAHRQEGRCRPLDRRQRRRLDRPGQRLERAAIGTAVGWDLPDRRRRGHRRRAPSPSATSRGLMNISMALAVNPASGEVTVVGTDATERGPLRAELCRPLPARQARARRSGTGPARSVRDLNPHLDYATPTSPRAERAASLGDPRGIAWNAAGTRGYVTGMGSNNVVVLDRRGERAGLAPTIAVGEGPTGIVLDEPRDRALRAQQVRGRDLGREPLGEPRSRRGARAVLRSVARARSSSAASTSTTRTRPRGSATSPALRATSTRAWTASPGTSATRRER